MELASRFGLTVLSMKGIIKMGMFMEMENLYGPTKNVIKANGRIIRWREEEYFYGQTVESTRDNLKMIENKDMES